MPGKYADQVLLGDCLEVFSKISNESVDLIYLDPPFFTQKIHSLTTRDGLKYYNFSDCWENINEYTSYIKIRLAECRKKLKPTGSLFLHCDNSASHYLKIVLDEVFGIDNFQSEIIWTYRRWSNAKKGLLNNHQNIFFYSKGVNFKFNPIFEKYSPTTNVDQIVQLRVRDQRNKSVYKMVESGKPQLAAEKKGVPIGDVWDIPFLNPKAKERVGYPTQKPILLLEKIISLVTEEGDHVLDPFCGSGTTLLAAKMLNRQFTGIDKNKSAVKLCRARLRNPIKTESRVLTEGRNSYLQQDQKVTSIIDSLGAISVQRNKGIDGLISTDKEIVPFKIVHQESGLDDSAKLIVKSTQKNAYSNKALYYLEASNTKLIDWIEKKYSVIVFSDLQILKQKLKNL